MEVNEKEMIEICEKIRKCEEEISKGIIGQKNIIREVLIAIFADGNVLLRMYAWNGKNSIKLKPIVKC